MQPRSRTVIVLVIALVFAGAGFLLTLVSAFLPWTWNSVHGGTSGISQLWLLYAAVLVLQALAVTLLTSRRSGWAVVLAMLAAAVVAAAMELTPRGIMLWDGVDALGRPTGGMERTTVGYGAVVALAGSLIHLAGSLVAWVAAVTAPRGRGHHEVGPSAGVSTPNHPAASPDGSAAPGRE